MTKSAFPILEHGGNGLELTDTGMNLRDYFAAKAMPIVYHIVTTRRKVVAPKRIAELAYAISDAMLAERAKTK